MSYPRTPTTTTSAATTTPNATPNEPYDASPGTPTVSATPSVSTPSKPHNSPNAASLTAIFDAGSAVAGSSCVYQRPERLTTSMTARKAAVCVQAVDLGSHSLTGQGDPDSQRRSGSGDRELGVHPGRVVAGELQTTDGASPCDTPSATAWPAPAHPAGPR